MKLLLDFFYLKINKIIKYFIRINTQSCELERNILYDQTKNFGKFIIYELKKKKYIFIKK
jgi:hypothetical protein